MTSDMCTEDVVVRITTPQIISSETIVSASPGVAPAGARVAAAVELGRRLLLAARAGDTPLVLDLMAKGAPFTTDWLGTSPLHLAASNAHAETCAVLLRAGVSRDARTKVERTPLHLAAAAGHAPVARLLLEAGAAVDCRDMLRMTPLHWAAQRGHSAVAAELLRRGADPHASSKFHKTPLSLALELRRDDLVKLIEDAIKDREAKKSVDALVNEQMSEGSPHEAKAHIFETVQRIQDIIPSSKIKQQPERVIKIEHKSQSGESEGERAAAQLLKKHGITLLPTDDGSTVLNALQSGRTVVLSDAGKLMLKESVTEAQGVSKPAAASCAAKGVVLTATPVRSPPQPGVKIFTLNNKLLAIPKEGARVPVKKIINPQDMQHVKFVQLPSEAKIISPSKIVPMKAKHRTRHPASPAHSSHTHSLSTHSTQGAASPRPAVKIIMNKTNFNRLMANAVRAEQPGVEEQEPGLRAALLAARDQVSALKRELRATKAKLSQYEPTA